MKQFPKDENRGFLEVGPIFLVTFLVPPSFLVLQSRRWEIKSRNEDCFNFFCFILILIFLLESFLIYRWKVSRLLLFIGNEEKKETVLLNDT